MTYKLSSFAFQIIYLFTCLTIADAIDIALLAVVFFIVELALHGTRSLQLVRGAIAYTILAAALPRVKEQFADKALPPPL
jgi:hypothetical protein